MKLSYSMLSQYKWCPKQYEYASIMQIPVATPWALYWGRSFHEGLEVAFKLRMNENLSVRESIDAGVKAFEDAMNRGVTRDFFRDIVNFTEQIDWGEIDSKQAMEIGKDGIITYLQEYLDVLRPTGIELLVAKKVMVDGEEHDFTSHLDLVTENIIVDHKTSNRSWSQTRADGEMQATAYLWNKPGNQDVLVYHIMLRQIGTKPQARMTRRTQEQLDEFEFETIPEIVRAIKSGAAPLTGDLWKCNFCGYRSICKEL